MDEATTQRALLAVAPQLSGAQRLDQLIRRLGNLEDDLAQLIESPREQERVQAMQHYRALPQAFAQALAQVPTGN